ncbi:MAG: NAD(P)-binding protein [Candidatus Aminicenantes bacterium]|nr:NAD(P)-binding protein [Candidatus Aminicenantes bacterium]
MNWTAKGICEVKSISILGAGPAGLSTGYHLDREYSIWEKNQQVGGGCRTEKVNGFSFDYGGHIFYPRTKPVKTLIRKLLKNDLYCMPREAWIYLKDIYTRYPFQANLYGHSVDMVKECLLGLMQAKLKYGEKPGRFSDFKDFIDKVFGEGMAKHFMIPFNKKQWGIPLNEMTVDWMGDFVPIPSLEEVLDGSLTMAPECMGINASFIYPKKGGIQTIFNSLVPFLQNVNTSSPVRSISLNNKSFQVQGHSTQHYETLVSSLPLPELVRISDPVPSEVKAVAEKLKWTSLYVVNIGIDRPDISEKHRVYYPEEDFVFHKLGYYQNQSPDMVPKGQSAVSAEISFSEYRKIDKTHIIERTVKDLQKAKVLSSDDRIVLTHVLTLPYAYALYDHHRGRAVARIKEFFESHDVYLCGRYAQWEYQNMEQNILAGKAMAERLNAGIGPKK